MNGCAVTVVAGVTVVIGVTDVTGVIGVTGVSQSVDCLECVVGSKIA